MNIEIDELLYEFYKEIWWIEWIYKILKETVKIWKNKNIEFSDKLEKFLNER